MAQQGTIIGTAVDETKAALPGVTITATDQDTGRVMSAVTDERGEYRLVNVLPGKYTIQAELVGIHDDLAARTSRCSSARTPASRSA